MICSWIDWIFPVLSSWLMGTALSSGPPPWSRLRYNYKGNFSIMPLAVVEVNCCSSVTDVSTLSQALWISLGKRAGQLPGESTSISVSSSAVWGQPRGLQGFEQDLTGGDLSDASRQVLGGREKLIRWLPSAAGAVPHQHRAERDSCFTPVFHRTRSIFRFFHITLTRFVYFIDPDKLLRHRGKMMNRLSLSLSSLFSRSSQLFGL